MPAEDGERHIEAVGREHLDDVSDAGDDNLDLELLAAAGISKIAIEWPAGQRGEHDFHIDSRIWAIQVAGMGDHDARMLWIGLTTERCGDISVSRDRQDIPLLPTVPPDRFNNRFRRL